MKHHLFFFVSCCLLSFAASAQSSWESLWYETPNGGSGSIVKAHSTSHNITYFTQSFPSGPRGSFVLSEPDIHYFKRGYFINGYFVNDFCILDNIVYFCGSNANATQAIIGWFHADALLNIQPCTYTYWLPSDVTSLNKIVAFKKNGTIHNACIGKYTYGNESYQCIFEADYNSATVNSAPSFLSYFFPAGNANYNTEWYSDIVVTDNYAAVIGERYDTENMILIRRMSINSSNPSTWDEFYTYGGLPPIEMAALPHATAMAGDTIALASLCSGSTGVSDFEIRVRFLNLSNCSMFRSQAIPIQDKADLFDMTYVPKNHSLMLSLPSGAECNLVRLSHLNAGNYTSWFVSMPGVSFPSICTSKNDLVVASNGWYLFAKQVSVNPLTYNSACYFADKIAVYSISSFPVVNSISNFLSYPIPSSRSILTFQLDPYDMNSSCISY